MLKVHSVGFGINLLSECTLKVVVYEEVDVVSDEIDVWIFYV